MTRFAHRGLRYGEVWFDEDPLEPPRVDIVRFRGRTQPLSGASCERFDTLQLDISQLSDRILARMSETTRYEIHRAESRDALVSKVWLEPPLAVLDEFIEFYADFAGSKHLPSEAPLLVAYLRSGRLNITRVERERSTLVWHAYVRGRSLTRLLRSASTLESANSLDRTLIGRANRWLHWQDMKAFSAAGISTYDFGGWYNGSTDTRRLSINRFKSGFGGRPTVTYDCLLPRTGKGRLFLAARDIIGRVRR